MKNAYPLIALVVWFLVAAVLYGASAFIAGDLDSTQWSEFWKGLVVFLWFATAPPIAVYFRII